MTVPAAPSGANVSIFDLSQFLRQETSWWRAFGARPGHGAVGDVVSDRSALLAGAGGLGWR